MAAQYGVTSFLAPIFDFSPSPTNVAALPVTRDAERPGMKPPTAGMIGYNPGLTGGGIPPYSSIPPQYHSGDMMMAPSPYGGDMYYMPPYQMHKDQGMTHGRHHSTDMTGLAPPATINGMGLPPSHADVYIDQYGQPHPTYHYAHTNGDDLPPPAKRQRSDDGDLGDFLPEVDEATQQSTHDEEMIEEEESDDDDGGDPSAVSLPFRLSVKPLRPKVGTITARTRSKLINAFSSDEPIDLKTSLGLTDDEASSDIDIDMVIDDQGHTALHWATALAKTSIISQLIDLGSDIHRGNYAGETPLIRAVLTTNNSEVGTFPALLSSLADSIKTIDHAHRSVIHHIALVAGVKGRAASARGYMAAILEYVAKEGGELGLPLKTLVNVQDVHGDTALNIAARVGSRALIQLLLDAGADKARANKLGLKPEDFGVEVEALKVSPGETIVASLKSEVPKPERRSRDVQKSEFLKAASGWIVLIVDISAIFETINETFAAEMTHKQTKLNATENSVRYATKALSEKRQQVARAQANATELEQVKQRIENVRRAIATLESQNWTGRSLLTNESNGTSSIPSAFRPVDGVQPHKGVGEDAALPDRGAPGSLKRLRRIAQWEDRMSEVLQDRLEALEGEGVDKAVKYRRLVSLCTKVPVEKVDGLLDVLTLAIESDGSSLDQGRLSGLLTRIKDGK